jgi:hypothetical protein
VWRKLRSKPLTLFGLPDHFRWLEGQIPFAVPWLLALQRVLAFVCLPILAAPYVASKLMEYEFISTSAKPLVIAATLASFIAFTLIPGFFTAVMGTLAVHAYAAHDSSRTLRTIGFALINYLVTALCAYVAIDMCSMLQRLPTAF